MYQLEVKPSKDGQHYFNLVSPENKHNLTGETYTRRHNVRKGLVALKSVAGDIKSYRFSDTPGNYRFTILARNYKVLARCTKGYKTRAEREEAVQFHLKHLHSLQF